MVKTKSKQPLIERLLIDRMGINIIKSENKTPKTNPVEYKHIRKVNISQDCLNSFGLGFPIYGCSSNGQKPKITRSSVDERIQMFRNEQAIEAEKAKKSIQFLKTREELEEIVDTNAIDETTESDSTFFITANDDEESECETEMSSEMSAIPEMDIDLSFSTG